MTDPFTPAPEEPGSTLPGGPSPGAPPPVPRAQAMRGPRLGHIVLGAVLVLIGVGWLLEALDLADVPWRLLLPSALILVGAALMVGARTGRHSGLVAVGAVLTVLVLLAGALEVIVNVPLAGGIGDKTHQPAAVVAEEYRWGMGKMTLDLRRAQGLPGESVSASVVLGELVVVVPGNVALVINARAGLGEVIVLGTKADGVDPALECTGTGRAVTCSAGAAAAEDALRLDLEVALGKVEVRR